MKEVCGVAYVYCNILPYSVSCVLCEMWAEGEETVVQWRQILAGKLGLCLDRFFMVYILPGKCEYNTWLEVMTCS